MCNLYPNTRKRRVHSVLLYMHPEPSMPSNEQNNQPYTAIGIQHKTYRVGGVKPTPPSQNSHRVVLWGIFISPCRMRPHTLGIPRQLTATHDEFVDGSHIYYTYWVGLNIVIRVGFVSQFVRLEHNEQ